MIEKLTKLYVDRLANPQAGQRLIWDSELTGFGLRLGKLKKTFVAEAKLRGKTVRVSVGTYPRMTVEQARKEAKKTLYDLERGIDPRGRAEGLPSLEDAFTAFKM